MAPEILGAALRISCAYSVLREVHGPVLEDSGGQAVRDPAVLPDGVTELEDDDPPALGPYRLFGRLGEGGMGTVFLAWHPAGGWVAAKTLHRHLARQPDFLARFAREVDNARRINSPYTPSVLDADTATRDPYLVTEFIAGPTLSQEIRRRGPLSRSELHQLAMNLASAMLAFHRVGIVHRDIKPANIILSRTGPRVIDLGISRALNEAVGITLSSGQQPGTPQLMAPEQWTGQRPTPATDVFAWGSVLTYAGTGRFPFTGVDQRGLRDAVLHSPPDTDGLDASLRPLILRTLAKDPAARPDVADLLADLLGGAAPQAATGIERAPVSDTTPITRTTPFSRTTPEFGVGVAQVPPTAARPVTDESVTAPAAPDSAARRGRRQVRRLTVLAGMLAIAAVVTVVALVIHRPTSPSRPATAAVPDGLIGLPATRAKASLQSAGFRQITQTRSPDARAWGTVLAVRPQSGDVVRVDSPVVLTVSGGASAVFVPNVIGQSRADAESALRRLDLTVTVLTSTAARPAAAPGHVEAQDHAGEKVEPATPVTITVVSLQLPVPDVVGQPARTAVEQLTEAGFQVTRAERRSDSAVGTVIDQQPRIVSADRGSDVRLVVSAGRPAQTAPPRATTPRATTPRATKPRATAPPATTRAPATQPGGFPNGSGGRAPATRAGGLLG
ncbi:PASTA domain-containing protein [Frankia sp. AiPs1]|uniref:protein kinase domain-containing protein n=1 Tax=Frankia sp. AiPs1 TaxID=573493 RepID=UPI0020443444|nr:PASTA domain-containing protein [Frankia sp. AiPs1]MCM3921199.1 PASTA domain-containing protein [Frankia sp. AiPs1]